MTWFRASVLASFIVTGSLAACGGVETSTGSNNEQDRTPGRDASTLPDEGTSTVDVTGRHEPDSSDGEAPAEAGSCDFRDQFGCFEQTPCVGEFRLADCADGIWSCPEGWPAAAEHCDPQAEACTPTYQSTLAGVRIEFFAPQPCSFTLGQASAGIEISYRVVVDQDVPVVTPTPGDTGRCGAPGPSGLIVSHRLDGEGQSYCLCDEGPCVWRPTTVALQQGVYVGTFRWSGRNWYGPSDTGNPMGAPFPPGRYILHVFAKGILGDADGGAPFEVTGDFPVTLTP